MEQQTLNKFIMKNYIKTILLTFIIGFVSSCEDPDNPIYTVLEDYTSGAILRTIELESGEFNSYDLNSFFAATIEEQDEQDGALLQSVDVYAGFKGAEALIETIQSSAFTAGPFGLPRTRIQVTLQQGINALGLSSSDYTGGDAMPIRLSLNLTDGRVFSSSDAGGALQGSFFNSPYAYNTVIKCIPNAPQAGTYKVDMIDTYGDGWNGASLDFIVDGTTTNLTISGAQGGSNSGTVTVPDGTSSFSVIFNSGAWDSEVKYTITFSKLDGSNTQVALSDGPTPAAGSPKIFSICQ